MCSYKRMIAMKTRLLILFVCAGIWSSLKAQIPSQPDSTVVFTPINGQLIQTFQYRPYTSGWGLDLMLSNNGFGLGGFYRHELDEDLAWSASIIFSGAKDQTEFEQYDYYTGSTYVLGKKNRLLMIPIHASLQYRLFREDITDSFRPYVTGGIGPTLMFVSPYASYTPVGSGVYQQDQVDFFTSLKYGTLRYTLGGYIGAGAYFGISKGTVSGISVRYYIASYSQPIEVMMGGFIKDFSGIAIIIQFGSLY